MRGGCRAPRCPSLLPEDHPRALLTATTTVPVSSLGGGFPPSGRCLRNQQFPPASFLWMKYKSRHRDASGRSRHRVAQAGGRAPNGKPRRSLELAGQPLTTCSRSPMCSARCSVKGAGREGRGVGLGPLWGGLGWGLPGAVGGAAGGGGGGGGGAFLGAQRLLEARWACLDGVTALVAEMAGAPLTGLLPAPAQGKVAEPLTGS